jgi:hypothetical protein
VLKRDIRRPDHVLNRDPLDNNFNRMGLIEKKQARIMQMSGGTLSPMSQQSTFSSPQGGTYSNHTRRSSNTIDPNMQFEMSPSEGAQTVR